MTRIVLAVIIASLVNKAATSPYRLGYTTIEEQVRRNFTQLRTNIDWEFDLCEQWLALLHGASANYQTQDQNNDCRGVEDRKSGHDSTHCLTDILYGSAGSIITRYIDEACIVELFERVGCNAADLTGQIEAGDGSECQEPAFGDIVAYQVTCLD